TSTGAPVTATVGPYDILISDASGTGLGNYSITYHKGTLTVGKKDLDVTADSDSKTYGDTHTFDGTEFTTSGLINGNTVTSATLSSTGAPVTATVGPYDILVSGAVGSGLGNYEITYTKGKLTVNTRPIEVTANPQSKNEGDPDPAFTYQITSGSLVTGDIFSGDLSRVAGESAGTYPIIQDTFTAGSNYDLKYVGADLTIIAKPVEDLFYAQDPFKYVYPQLERMPGDMGVQAHPMDAFTSDLLMRSNLLYHPLTPSDMAAFDALIISDDAYTFIDGALNLIGHDGLLPLLDEIIKKRKQETL
ncbi:MAG: MBG domain-containing protein, partial [Candidatus Omnitrophica bacterium]|nr:MBG domain-containing protein [Candidatus Omnitrophota bacterium]